MDNRDFLAKRRDKAIAIFLSYKEREIDPHIDSRLANDLRKQFLDQINDVCDLALDLLNSDNIIFNDEFMGRLDDIYEKLSELSE